MLRSRRHQRGETQSGCLIGLVILLIACVLAYKLIPVKVKAADMRDTMVDEAKSAAAHDEKMIMKILLQKAKELEFPITEDNIHIDRNSSYIKIDMKYTVPVDFPGYTYKWNFHHHTENPIF